MSLPPSTMWMPGVARSARRLVPDRLRIGTGLADQPRTSAKALVHAVLVDSDNPQRRSEGDRYAAALRIVASAAASRHEPVVFVRDGEESMFGCQRCDALGYVDAAASPAFLGWQLLEAPCSDDRPPRPTAITAWR